MPLQRRVYLMRHADVSYVDAQGRPVHPDAVALTTEGQAQARAVAGALGSVPLDRIVCSGLPRTLETAALVAGDRALPIEVREPLREIRSGPIADLAPEGFEDAFVGALHRPQQPQDRFLGGETWGSLQQRVRPCLGELLAEPGWRHLLIVAHGGVNRVILLDALGGDLRDLGRLEQDPAALNILDLDAQGRVLVRLMNHTPYDETKGALIETTMEKLFREIRSLEPS